MTKRNDAQRAKMNDMNARLAVYFSKAEAARIAKAAFKNETAFGDWSLDFDEDDVVAWLDIWHDRM